MRRRTAIDKQPVAEALGLFRCQGPIAEGRNIRIDQTLFIGTPAGGMVRIAGMIENRDAEGFASKRALDVAPRGALLFALPAAESVRVQVCLTRVGFVPRVRTAPKRVSPGVSPCICAESPGRRYGTCGGKADAASHGREPCAIHDDVNGNSAHMHGLTPGLQKEWLAKRSGPAHSDSTN